jgi:hypothetical protein
MSSISLRIQGAPNSLDYKVYFEKDKKLISPFHDIPMSSDGLMNMVLNDLTIGNPNPNPRYNPNPNPR